MPATAAKPFTRRRRSVSATRRRAPPARPGSAISASGTTKLSKSSWSCSQLGVVMGAAVRRYRPRLSSAEPEERWQDRPCRRSTGTILTARGSALAIVAHRAVDARRIEEVALVEHDEVGAGDLILEHFLDRIVVIEGRDRRRAGARALRDRRRRGRSASAAPSTTATTPSTVTRLLIAGQWKACTSGLGSARPEVSITMCSTAGCRARMRVERRHELVGHRAAQAAVGELDDVLLRAGGDRRSL